MYWGDVKKQLKKLSRGRLVRLSQWLHKAGDDALVTAGELALLRVADWLTIAPLNDDGYWLLLGQFRPYLEDLGERLEKAKPGGKFPAAMLVISNRRYVTATGLHDFYDLAEGQTVPEIPEPVMEMISYSLTTLVLLRGAQARETFEHGRTEDLDRG